MFPCLFPPLRPLDAHDARFAAFVRDSARIQFTRYTLRPRRRVRTCAASVPPSCSATPIIAHAQHTLQAVFLSKNGFSLKIIFSYRLLTFLFHSVPLPCFRANIHYIYRHVFAVPRLPRPAPAIKIFLRFPLCYYYIASMRFCQAFQGSFTFPNMTDCTNTKRSIHSKHSRRPSRRFFRRRPYIPAPES